jgi:hypothetical protein
MGMRINRAVGLVVLLSMVLAGAGQLVSSPANTALSAQVGMMGAAVHAGSCANPSPVPFVLLNALVPAGSSDTLGAPLFSNTDASVTLTDLLSSPHAILVTLGGDVDALLACRDLDKATGAGSVSVDLHEENSSGYSGVALLTATGETTQVSVILAQMVPQAPATAAPTSRGPASPVAIATPEPTPKGGVPPIVLLPTATVPSVTPAGSPRAAGSPYVSQLFGYSIAYVDPWQIVAGPDVSDSVDYIQLSDGASNVDFVGLAEDLTPSACMDRIYDQVILHGIQGLVLVAPHVGGEPIVSTPQEAVEVWDFSFVADNGQRYDNTFYAHCTILEPGQSVLLITQESPQAAYPAEAAAREELLQGLTLPQ